MKKFDALTMDEMMVVDGGARSSKQRKDAASKARKNVTKRNLKQTAGYMITYGLGLAGCTSIGMGIATGVALYTGWTHM